MDLRLPRIALAVVASALALSGCVALPPGPDVDMPCGALGVAPLSQCSQVQPVIVEQVVVSQSQALPDFDGGRYLQTDPEALADLEQILASRGPGDIAESDACPGSRATLLEVQSANTDDFTVATDSCDDAEIAAEIDELATEWLASGTLPPAP